MKKLNLITKLVLSLVFLVLIASCSDDDNTTIPQPLNVVQTAQTVPQLSILVDAVIQAGLVDALTAAGDKTVLAPTNDAFLAFLNDKGFNSLSDVPNDVLTQILLNHVIPDANIQSSALTGNTGYANTLADGPGSTKLSIYYDGTSGVTFNGGASVSLPDVETTNGIVHIIDEVIDLPTIATFATSNPALSILVDALAYADTGTPTVPYITTVSNPDAGPFTVFAPTNDAFVSLLNHIVGANVQSTQLTSGAVTTLGGDITADATAFTLTDANDRVSNIVTSLVNIQGVNGVVHVIDKVILPAP